MATLTDAFLADLDELSDGDEANDSDKSENEQEDDGAAADLAGIALDDLSAIAKLSASAKYRETVERVQAEQAARGDSMPEGWAGPSELDPVYQLIVACNELAMGIDAEIDAVYNFIKHRYKPRFAELQSLVQDPVAYARCVARIGNEEDVTTVDLSDVLPQHVVMIVSVTASTTDSTPLPPSELARVREACALVERLDGDRRLLLRFVGSRMALVAPNVSEVTGADVAAKLVGAAGGLAKLSEIPGCNIQVLGQKRKINAGLSTANIGANQGYVYGCPVVTAAPPELRRKAAKLVANKVALLARFDAHGTPAQRSGDEGRRMRDVVQKTIDKWQEPPPARLAKPLPAPDAVSRKRRGGKRYRKQKEKLSTTEMMKYANRMKFGEAEEEYIDGDEMFGLGMLGKEGHGKLKIMQAASKITKKERAMQKRAAGTGAGGAASLAGTASSLAFSHVQGIELENPNREVPQEDVGSDRGGTESYFSELSGFKTLRRL